MSKRLTEARTRFTKLISQEIKLLERKKEIEGLMEGSEIFQEYLQILYDLQVGQKTQEKCLKGELYESMVDDEKDEIKCRNYILKLKKPYIKRTFNSDKFYKENKPDSKLYKKYIQDKEVKGNVSISKLY